MARRPPSKVVPFRKPRKRHFLAGHRVPKARLFHTNNESKSAGIPRIGPIMVMLPLAAFTAVFLWDGPPAGLAFPFEGETSAGDQEAAHFTLCNGPVRVNCVIDGDTFWYAGKKIRIADINTPEMSNPACAGEERLARAATRRLQDLLNEGPFTLARNPFGDNRDKYGRDLRTITRNGESLGATLVSEGLAENWRGYRRGWC